MRGKFLIAGILFLGSQAFSQTELNSREGQALRQLFRIDPIYRSTQAYGWETRRRSLQIECDLRGCTILTDPRKEDEVIKNIQTGIRRVQIQLSPEASFRFLWDMHFDATKQQDLGAEEILIVNRLNQKKEINFQASNFSFKCKDVSVPAKTALCTFVVKRRSR